MFSLIIVLDHILSIISNGEIFLLYSLFFIEMEQEEIFKISSFELNQVSSVNYESMVCDGKNYPSTISLRSKIA